MIKRYRVDQQDGNTYFLVDLDMVDKVNAKGFVPLAEGLLPVAQAIGEFIPNAISTGVWAKSSEPLKVGSTVDGSFNFDPKESLKRMEFPIFTPSK